MPINTTNFIALKRCIFYLLHNIIIKNAHNKYLGIYPYDGDIVDCGRIG